MDFYDSNSHYYYSNKASLEHWNKLARDYPCLPVEEELALVEKVKVEDCKDSLDFLVLSNICNVLHVLRQMKVPHYIDSGDLVAESVIILYDKIPQFDLSYRKPLFSYLYYPVKWSMLETLKKQNVVSLNVKHYTEIAKYNQIKEDYFTEHGREPDDKYISEQMGIRVTTVANIRARINVLEPVSLDYEIDEDFTIRDTIECSKTEKSKSRWEATTDLKHYLGFLPPQGQIVLILTEGPGIFDFDSYKLEDVGTLLGLSLQRICTIKAKSLKRLLKISTLEKKNEGERVLQERFKRWPLIDLDQLKKDIRKKKIESKEERRDRKSYEKELEKEKKKKGRRKK